MSHSLSLEQSQQLKESTMDISDTLQEYPSQSPDDDDDEDHDLEPSSIVGFANKSETNQNNLTNNGSENRFSQRNGITENLTIFHGSDSLDNRKPNGLYLDISRSSSAAPLSSSPRSALTLANSHPLMFSESSSIDNDSDSEIDPNHQIEAEQIPQTLRLGQPLLTDIKESNNTTFSSSQNITTHETNRLLNLVSNTKQPNADKEILEFGSSDDEQDVASEPDISQYQANVNPHYQSVVLVSRPDHQPTTNFQRKIPVSADLLSDSMSSLDSISQNSFDEDLENNLVSVSISSSVLDDTGFNGTEGASGGGLLEDVTSPVSLPTDHMTTPIPQYTATEEARDTRSWQKITLPDGRTREIDMKVIEPYKRVLSHGGYLNSGGHNAIVVFSACHLPDRSRKDYHYVMDNLFLYVIKTLDQLITDDYVLVYLHGGASRSNAPQFPWLKRCYQLLDRRLRKSLKTLYMVHPTFWLKSVVWMARPFISSKFWRKLVYVRTLDEMYHHVPVERAAVPEKVLKYDLKYT